MIVPKTIHPPKELLSKLPISMLVSPRRLPPFRAPATRDVEPGEQPDGTSSGSSARHQPFRSRTAEPSCSLSHLEQLTPEREEWIGAHGRAEAFRERPPSARTIPSMQVHNGVNGELRAAFINIAANQEEEADIRNSPRASLLQPGPRSSEGPTSEASRYKEQV